MRSPRGALFRETDRRCPIVDSAACISVGTIRPTITQRHAQGRPVIVFVVVTRKAQARIATIGSTGTDIPRHRHTHSGSSGIARIEEPAPTGKAHGAIRNIATAACAIARRDPIDDDAVGDINVALPAFERADPPAGSIRAVYALGDLHRRLTNIEPTLIDGDEVTPITRGAVIIDLTEGAALTLHVDPRKRGGRCEADRAEDAVIGARAQLSCLVGGTQPDGVAFFEVETWIRARRARGRVDGV